MGVTNMTDIHDELPGSWEETPGEGGENTYTRFLFNPENQMEARQYTDPDRPHQVVVMGPDGYVEYSESFQEREKAEKNLNRILQKYTA